jgi:hypothetical protein
VPKFCRCIKFSQRAVPSLLHGTCRNVWNNFILSVLLCNLMDTSTRTI